MRSFSSILPVAQPVLIKRRAARCCANRYYLPTEDQNDNFNPSSPIRGGVWVDKIFPKVALVNVVFGFPSTV